MLWFILMFLLLPLAWDRGASSVHHRWLRTWLAVVGASVASYLLPYPVAFIVIDFIAAVIVVRRPRGFEQKLICALFSIMMMFEIGYVLSEQMNPHVVTDVGFALGWIMWLLLLVWGLNEHYKLYGDLHCSSGSIRPSLAHTRDDAQ